MNTAEGTSRLSAHKKTGKTRAELAGFGGRAGISDDSVGPVSRVAHPLSWSCFSFALFAAACAGAARVEPNFDVSSAASEPVAQRDVDAIEQPDPLDGFAEGDEPQEADVEPVLQDEPPEPIRHAFHTPLPTLEELASGAASKWANLSPADCRKRLSTLKLPVERVGGPAPGVATPLRITGPMGDVHFQVPPARTPFGMLDCRLALVLAEMAEVLAEHDVVRVRIDNFYRPRARLPRRKALSQHAHGLAADVVEFVLRDGVVLNVENDWQGNRGEPPCGPDAQLIEETERSVRLRNLVCAIAAKGLFHHILTPSYDPAHRDHVHMDIKRDKKWFGVR